MRLLPNLITDFYKIDHVSQFPSGVEQIWLNWTPRATRVPGLTEVTLFGLQAYIKEYLEGRWQVDFFRRPWSEIRDEYTEIIQATLGIAKPRVDHLEWLHRLQHLPIDIYTIPEGFATPLGVPHFVITNTAGARSVWLPGLLETQMSTSIWGASTSATTARRYRGILEYWARTFGHTDLSFVDWQGHDFSERGMMGLDAVMQSGMGHLTAFSGTDSIPAILAAREYYGAPLDTGGSVPATEHSVMCAGLKDNEFETFERLITKVYPTGIVSIVSDTWDLWKVLTEYIPRLREVIRGRQGKVVIRPDSGDPVKIILGDPESPNVNAQRGALRLLADALGTTDGLINNGGLIYGDGITPDRANQILGGCVALGLSPFNVVLGIGSYTYQHVTRDTHYFAIKATGEIINGIFNPMFKDPVTDDGRKRSARGIPAVYRTVESTEAGPQYFMSESAHPGVLDYCAFNKVYSGGHGGLLLDWTFDQIRQRVRTGIVYPGKENLCS